MERLSGSPPTLEQIRSAVQARMPWGTKALQRLISIDSISPDELECQLALADILRAEGLAAELIPLDDGKLRSVEGFIETGLPLDNRPNLVAAYGGTREAAKSLILNAHIDTVPWKDQLDRWQVHPLSGEIRDGKIYGRGSMDDKGLVMLGAMAILALRDLGYEPPGKVILESVVDEEPGGNGTLSLCAQGYVADAAINLEPTDNQVIYGHRGVVDVRYRVTGEARHASVGSSLSNAIVEAGFLAHTLDRALEGWSDPTDSTYGPPSVNVGRIEGGDDIFTTPIECRIQYGIRYAPGTYKQILAHIDRYIRQHVPGGETALGRVESKVFAHYDAMQVEPSSDFVQSFLATVREVEPDRELGVFRACSDARHLINRYNIPTVVFGPSQVALAHRENEYLDLCQWQLAIQEVASFIVRWCV